MAVCKIKSKESFKKLVIECEMPVLVAFTGEVPVCRDVQSVMEHLADVAVGKMRVAVLDVADYPEALKKYEVQMIPNVRFFKNGRRVKKHEEFSRAPLGPRMLLKLQDFAGVVVGNPTYVLSGFGKG